MSEVLNAANTVTHIS